MNGTGTDVGTGAVDRPPDAPADPEVCHCGHPEPDHDAVALRYCAATSSGGLDRSCICRVAPPKPYHYR